RAGVEVLVVEKHADFLRDFRSDTIHPSTLDVLHDLRLAEPLLKLPHQKVRKLQFHAGSATYPIAEFGDLPLRYPFVAMMPQWDFLNFLAREAARFAPFNLIMEAAAKSLIEENGRVAGLRIDTAGGPIEVRADLTIAADGRRSVLREQAGLAVAEVGAPMDVLWFSLVREKDDPHDVAGFLGAGKALVAINRGDYWQCGLIIPKGAFGAIQAAGIEAFRKDIEAVAPPFRGRMAAVADWNDVRL